jgi:hypothetical protein
MARALTFSEARAAKRAFSAPVDAGRSKRQAGSSGQIPSAAPDPPQLQTQAGKVRITLEHLRRSRPFIPQAAACGALATKEQTGGRMSGEHVLASAAALSMVLPAPVIG